jgi:hypothetical protein
MLEHIGSRHLCLLLCIDARAHRNQRPAACLHCLDDTSNTFGTSHIAFSHRHELLFELPRSRSNRLRNRREGACTSRRRGLRSQPQPRAPRWHVRVAAACWRGTRARVLQRSRDRCRHWGTGGTGSPRTMAQRRREARRRRAGTQASSGRRRQLRARMGVIALCGARAQRPPPCGMFAGLLVEDDGSAL